MQVVISFRRFPDLFFSGGFSVETYDSKQEAMDDLRKFLTCPTQKETQSRIQQKYFAEIKEETMERKQVAKRFSIPLENLHWSIANVEMQEVRNRK